MATSSRSSFVAASWQLAPVSKAVNVRLLRRSSGDERLPQVYGILNSACFHMEVGVHIAMIVSVASGTHLPKSKVDASYRRSPRPASLGVRRCFTLVASWPRSEKYTKMPCDFVATFESLAEAPMAHLEP